MGAGAWVRSGEGRDVAAGFATLGSIVCTMTVLETARDALSLARLPAARLPWMYLAVAAVAGALAWRGLAARAGARSRLQVFLLSSSLLMLGFWIGGAARRPLLLYALYVGCGVFATLSAARFWGLAGQRFSITQAKRLCPLIGAGAVTGALVGSVIALAVLPLSISPARGDSFGSAHGGSFDGMLG